MRESTFTAGLARNGSQVSEAAACATTISYWVNNDCGARAPLLALGINRQVVGHIP